jgi:uncharacterized protein
MKKMNPVVHFEMPAKDRIRMADFYSRAFGWKSDLLGEDMGNYVTVTTTPSGERNRPLNPGAINGGFYPVKPEDNTQHPSLVIGVENIKESAEAVVSSGGRVLGEPVEIPGVGLYLSFIDTEGNRLSILQPFMQ